MPRITLARQRNLTLFVEKMIDERRGDWQFIAVEAIEYFDWLTADDWDFVCGVINDAEWRAGDPAERN